MCNSINDNKELKINTRRLLFVLSKMLSTGIKHADYKIEKLQGGTVGDVQLITGIAESSSGDKIPYRIVLKVQKKWERPGDILSWRREYDLYSSKIPSLFTGSLRWPVCYFAQINNEEDETQIWMEYIEGISGYDLSIDMLKKVSREIGRFQGKIYSEKPAFLHEITNLGNAGGLKEYYFFCKGWTLIYDYIRSDVCEIPKHLCKMIIDVDENSDEIWQRIEVLPIVFCHRDFWVTNIFYKENGFILIDWDTAGWGYLGEDVRQLISDEVPPERMLEYYSECVPEYYIGFSEYVDISHITDKCIKEMIIFNYGYRLVDWYKTAKTEEEKELHLNVLQKIYEMT